MSTIKIETRKGHFEEFNVIPIKCKVGDTIWWNDGDSECPRYLEGKVLEVDPKHWWIYDNGDKVYGCITVEGITKESSFCGQNFRIDADEIIYEKPQELFDYPLSFRDDIDEWLYKEFSIIGGCCSAQSSLEYNTARMVAEKLWNNDKGKD